jgi:hypothetical protein
MTYKYTQEKTEMMVLREGGKVRRDEMLLARNS